MKTVQTVAEPGSANRAFRFKRILCPVDFSPASLRAFDLAVQLASMHGGRVHVLHVIPRIVASLLDIPITTSRWTAAQEEKAKHEFPKLTERARKHGISATTEIKIGDIDIQILKAAKETKADLLAMGTHGRRGFERWALGSVAERMLRYSPIPVLLTASTGKRAAPGTIRKILMPTDFSQGVTEAIGYGVEIAVQAGASILLLHVIQDRSAAVDWKSFPEQTAAIQRKLEQLIPVRSKLLRATDARVESGEPYRVILKAIKDSKPSLVVLSTHGHGFVHRVLIGSTAERVIRGGAAMCPMLMIPPRGSTSTG